MTRCTCQGGLQGPHLPTCASASRRPYERPLVVASSPARVNVAALLGAPVAAGGRPPGVPPEHAPVPLADLRAWRELAMIGGPCRECDDALCQLARAVLAYTIPA